MFCYKCGKEMEESDKFCNSCGAAVGTVENRDYWKYFGYAWTVIVNLITVVIVFAIYGNVYASVDTIVVSLLILIYLSIQSFSMIYGKTTIETAFALDLEFKRIRRLLKYESNEEETEEIQEVKNKVNKAMVKMYIKASFILIIYIITIFNLLGVL